MLQRNFASLFLYQMERSRKMEIHTVSISVSSVILIATLVTSLVSVSYWRQHKKEPKLPCSWPWKTVLRHVIIVTTSISFGISLLALSVLRNEKACVILLLCFGRILIIGQVGYRKDLAKFSTDYYRFGPSGKAVLLCCTNIYIGFC